jgi:hypothetical protein
MREPASRWERIIIFGILVGIVLGLAVNAVTTVASTEYVYAKEKVEPQPVEVKLEVKIDWSDERIEQEIRNTFTEDPETAIKIARCENGWNPKRGYDVDIQSGHILHYGQERSFGIFQIHAPDWHKTAMRLGYDNYQSDPAHNIAMARHIYDNAGKKWRDWTCYTKKMI